MNQFRDWKLSTNEREKYQLYLASREWAEKKERVKSRSRGTCERCRYATGEQVHHLTYANKYNEPLEDLMHLCEPCHEFLSAKSSYDPRLAAPVCLYGRTVRNVYLAGKISNDNWRDELVDGYSESPECYGAQSGGRADITWETVNGVLPIPDGRRLNLTGPFWVDGLGGHGSQNSNHGIHCCGYWNGSHNDTLDLLPQIESAIKRSDLIFAWINRLDCYGTLIEIGYARALGKLIAIATPEFCGSGELWMAGEIANVWLTEPSPKEAWKVLWKDC